MLAQVKHGVPTTVQEAHMQIAAMGEVIIKVVQGLQQAGEHLEAKSAQKNKGMNEKSAKSFVKSVCKIHRKIRRKLFVKCVVTFVKSIKRIVEKSVVKF